LALEAMRPKKQARPETFTAGGRRSFDPNILSATASRPVSETRKRPGRLYIVIVTTTSYLQRTGNLGVCGEYTAPVLLSALQA
jgi:hypothetical protein